MGSYIGQSSLTALPKRSDGLLDLWRSIIRHKLLFTAITGTFCVLGALYILQATPQYRAEALLRVQTKSSASISALSDVSGAMPSDVSANDESDVLTSRSIVGEAIVQTGAETTVQTESHFPLIGQYLASRHIADNQLAPPVLGLSGYAWGGERLKPGIFTVPTAVLGDKFRVVAGEAGQWTLYDKADVQLAQGRVGQLVSFHVDTPDGDAPGELRIDMLRARPGVEFTIRRQSAQMVYDNVDNQLRTSVSRESSIRDPSMMRLSYQADTPLGAQMMVNAIVKTYLKRDIEYRAEQAQLSLDFLRRRLPALKMDLEIAEDRLNQYRTETQTIDKDQQSYALVTRMNSLAEHKTLLQLALDEQKQKYHPGSPAYQTALSQLDEVKREMQETDETAAKLPSTQREYVRLSRDVAVDTQLYTSVLTNAQQLEVAAASTAPGVSVVDWAIAPEKASWPRKGIVLLGSILGGLFVSTVAVHLVSLKRKELRTPEEIDHISQFPRLAVVAQSSAQFRHGSVSRRLRGTPAKLLAVSNPSDPSIEALRSLRSSLRALLAGTDGQMTSKMILFTGPTQGVGKSFVSSNFAYLLAETNASVLLIDADMRQGRLSSLLHGQRGAGLAEVLAGTAQLEDAITGVDQSSLSILHAGASSPLNPSELLGRPAFREMLATLRERYDFVVIDSPPVLPVSDALSIAAQGCDLVLLVSRADYTGARQLEETLRRLENVGAKVGGHIFNGFLPGRYGEREEYGLNIAKH